MEANYHKQVITYYTHADIQDAHAYAAHFLLLLYSHNIHTYSIDSQSQQERKNESSLKKKVENTYCNELYLNGKLYGTFKILSVLVHQIFKLIVK